jgi:hypothetical protein
VTGAPALRLHPFTVKALGALSFAFILLLWYVFGRGLPRPLFLGDDVVLIYISAFLSDAAAGHAAARC